MEYAILYSYWEEFYKKKKEEEKNKNIKDKLVWILLAGITFWGLCTLVVDIIARTQKNESMLVNLILPVIFITLQLVCTIILYIHIYQKNYQITKEGIETIKKHYVEVCQWFMRKGYSEKKQIAQLGYRCEKKLEEMQSEKMRIYNLFEKIITIFFVPAIFAILTWILSNNTDLHDMKEYVFLVVLVVTFCAAIYLLISSILKSVETSERSDIRKMKCLIRDINGILDYCYNSKDEDDESIRNENGVGQLVIYEKYDVHKRHQKYTKKCRTPKKDDQ